MIFTHLDRVKKNSSQKKLSLEFNLVRLGDKPRKTAKKSTITRQEIESCA